MRIRWAAAAVASLVLLAGCATSAPPPPTATLRQANATSTSTTTSTNIDVQQVPVSADVAYAQAVMNRLDHTLGDGLRLFAKAKGPSQEFYDYLRAVYDDQAYDQSIADFGRIAAQDPENVRATPGDPTTKVTAIVGSSGTCMLMTVERSFSGFLHEVAAPRPGPGLIQLLGKRPDQDPRQLNPTAWVIVADGRTADGSVPESLCQR